MKNIVYTLLLICGLFCQCTKDGSAFISSAGQGGSLARFAISGNYLYTVNEDALDVYDISSPENPAHTSHIMIGFEIETIYPFKDKLFIGSTSVVYIYSTTNPAKPEKLGEAISPQVLRRCDPVVAKDTVAFATLRTNGPCGGVESILAVYDIKDIQRPVQKASLRVGEPYGLGYWNNVLYVCDKTGLLVVDISKPYQPRVIRSLTDASYVDVIPYQNILICWVTDGVLMYDISDNENPVKLAKII